MTHENFFAIVLKSARPASMIFLGILAKRAHLLSAKFHATYEGGFSESLNTLISLEPLGAEQANNPHMKA